MPSIAEGRSTDKFTEKLEVFKRNKQLQLRKIAECIEDPRIIPQHLPFMDPKMLYELSAAIIFDIHDTDNTIEVIEQLSQKNRPSDLRERIKVLNKGGVLFESTEILRRLKESK